MPKTNKLLHITTVPDSLDFFAGQINFMREQGLLVEALASPGQLPPKFAAQKPVIFHAVEMPRRITPLQDLLAIFRLWKKIKKINPQIVHAHTPKGGLLGTIAATLAGVPIRIYHIHGLPLMTAKGYKKILLQLSEKVSCLLAHQVLCVSHSVRHVVVKENLCPSNKVKVILSGSINGIDAKGYFNPSQWQSAGTVVRQKFNIPEDALVLGFIGRIVKDKGIGELVQAWQVLRAEFPQLHLLMVGPFEPQDPISSDAEYCLKNDPRIHLAGMDWHTPPYYSAMDLLVLPTYREGFPVVPLEAAAMKLPIVSTQVPGCIDAVVDGVTGTLVYPGDAYGLTIAIRTYLNDAQLRQKHAQAALSRVLSDFLPETLWQAFYQEYLRLLAEKGITITQSPDTIHEQEKTPTAFN